MKSGSGKRNLLLAATIVSLSVTMPMNVAYAETPSIPSRGVNSVYETTQVTDPDKISNHEYAFSTTDGSTTKYWNYNPILSKINGTHTTSSETYSSGAIEIYTGGADTPILYYTYTKPSEWTNTSRTDNITENINNVVFNRVSSYSLPWGATDLVGGVLSNTDTDNSAITINADFIQGNKNNYAGYYVGTGIFNHAVENNSKLGNISGDFVDNKASFGSAIFNYTNSTQHAAQLGDITGNFINNRTNDMGYYQSKQGGAIWNNGVIGNINGNFVGNFVGSNYTNIQAHGGAIFNRGGNIGNIEGNFLYNTASPNYDISKFFTNPISGAKAYGGAIFNGLAEETKSGASAASQAQSPKPVDRDSVIGNITGDFIGNMAYNAGGAIYNGDANGYNIPLNTTKSTIGDITGDFINNYAEEGGAIYNGVGIGENPTFKTINSITGNFIRNEAAVGGAIYNNVGTIGDINANFIENSGGAISSYFGAFNNINGNFTGNTDYNLGAAISVQGGIVNGNITGNFIDNSVSGTYESKGGAISIITSDTQGQISANFNDNSVTSTDSNAYGGAIYYEGGQTGEHGLDISNSTFTSNSATSTNANGYGGAIYNDGQIGHYETTINEGTYEEETKLTGGGLLGSTFSGNSASTSGGAIYNNSSAVINIISADFENNSANANGGAVFNEGTIGIDNGYGYITDGGFIDSSFRNNSATESGGAIYNNSSDKPVLITAKTKDITFSGNKAANGASIYNTSSGGTSITANGGNVTFTNNTPTDESGYGIYSAATVNLVANDGYSIKIDDSINISNPYADITVNQGYGYTGAVELNGKIKFNNSNQGIRVGFAGFDSGTLKLGQTPANDTYNYLQTAGNFTLDLQNEHAGDNLVLKQLSGTATMKLNVDYDATANSMDKITVNGGSGTITLNAVNVLNDNASFVDGTEATYLDGEVKNNITVISDAIQSTVAGTTVYTFTPDSTTHGLLTVTRAESYAGDLINAIQDDIADVHPNAYSMQENFTADRNFGALNTENREQFTIFGNSHTISGDNNTYTGIEVASGQTLNLDNVRFSNVKTYDVQNAGTLNLSGNNTIKTITDAATPTGTTNITGGTTTIADSGSVTQSAVNMHGGRLVVNSSATVNKVVASEDYHSAYSTETGDANGGVIYNQGTITTLNGKFTGNSANVTNYNAYGGAIYNNSQLGTISADFISNSANGYKSYGGAIYNEGAITSISDSTFDNNSVTSENNNVEGGAIYNGSLHTIGNIGADFTNNSASGEYAYGGAIYNYSSSTGTTSIGAITKITNGFKGNSATATSGNAYGGAIYNLSAYQPSGVFTPSFVSIGNLNTDFTQNHVEATGEALGGAIYNATNPTYKNYNKVSIGNINGNFTGNYAKSTGGSSNAQGGAIFITNANVGNITGDFEGNYTETYKGQAGGGAIIINNTSSNTVGTILGNFTGNYAKSTVSSNIENSNGAYAGAIFNNTSDLTIENSTFTGNYVESERNSGNQNSHGGAIYNKGNINISNTTFDGNYAKGNGGAFAYGGAIYNNFSNDTSKVATITGSTFTNNSTIDNWGNADGGAIYQNRGTLNLIDTSFTGNKGTDGAAISAWNANVTVYAKNSDVEFTNNNITGLADGDGYGIGIYGGTSLNLKADTGKTLTINDNIFSGYGMTINADGNGGTVALNNAIQQSGGSKVTLNSGTLALGQNALNSFATSSNNLNFVAQGGTLDIANGAVDTMTFANAVDIQGAMNLGLDVDLTGSTASDIKYDVITADITGGNTSPITISALNFINDNYTGSEEEHNLTIASGTIKSIINETVNPTVTGNTKNYSYAYDQDTGILTLTIATYNNIHEAVADNTKAARTYKIKLAEGETVEHAIGAIAGATSNLTINGDNKYLDGKVGGVNQGGFIVADGQTLTLKDISSLKNFTTAVDNAGTLNVENVTFTGNTTADINNTATLNLSGSNTIKTITGSTGTTNITGGTTIISQNGSATQKVINISDGELIADYGTTITATEGVKLQGGTLKAQNGATVNNIIADEHYTGNRLVVLGG